MRRPLIGRQSITSMAVKPLLILALAIAALFVAPAAASAAPAGAAPAGKITAVAPERAGAAISGTESSQAEAGINAIFNCQYFSRSPFQVISFSCLVQSGSIRVVVNCADGRQVFGPIVFASLGVQNFSISCAPARVSTFFTQQLS
jgi:hypothetical protein